MQFIKRFSTDDNTWEPDLNEVLNISDEMAFLFRLPNGDEQIIDGFNIRTTLIENDFPVNATLKINIRENRIDGGISF